MGPNKRSGRFGQGPDSSSCYSFDMAQNQTLKRVQSQVGDVVKIRLGLGSSAGYAGVGSSHTCAVGSSRIQKTSFVATSE